MEYKLPVKGEKVKPQQVTALHLFCGLAYVGSGAIIYVYNYVITYWGLALLLYGLALLVVVIIKNKWVVKKKVTFIFRVQELLVSTSIALYSFLQHWTFPIVIFSCLVATILFAFYWERAAGQSMSVNIDENGVRLPSGSRRRIIGWNEIEHVLLRYGILSIDCIDNTLYQIDVSGFNGDATALEDFCKGQVIINSDKRINNDW